MKKKNQSLLWQFNTEGSPHTHYLIGTMHSRDNRAFKHLIKFFRAIIKCNIFAAEFALDDAEDFNVKDFTTLPNGGTLTSVLSPKLYAKTTALFKKKLQLDLTQYEHYTPYYLINILSEEAQNSENSRTLDETMWLVAKEDGKILRGIETFDEQLEILQKLSMSDDIKSLKEIVSKHDKFRKKLQNMIKLYEKQDVSALYQLAKKTTKANRKLMLFDRNELMTKRIMELCKENTLCVAVGAGHLGGEKGILNLLKKQGFILKPV